MYPCIAHVCLAPFSHDDVFCKMSAYWVGFQARTQYFSKNVILKGEAEMRRVCVLFWDFSAYKMNTPKLMIGACQQDLPPLIFKIDTQNNTIFEAGDTLDKSSFCILYLFINFFTGVNLGTSCHSI